MSNFAGLNPSCISRRWYRFAFCTAVLAASGWDSGKELSSLSRSSLNRKSPVFCCNTIITSLVMDGCSNVYNVCE